MGITGILIAIAIIIVVLAFAGTQVSAFINDTFANIGMQIRDSETKIDAPIQGDIVCDMFVTANWEEQTTVIFALEPQPILFFDPNDVEGVGIDVNFQNCGIAGGIGLSFLPLLDFLGTNLLFSGMDASLTNNLNFLASVEFGSSIISSICLSSLSIFSLCSIDFSILFCLIDSAPNLVNLPNAFAPTILKVHRQYIEIIKEREKQGAIQFAKKLDEEIFQTRNDFMMQPPK